MSAFTCLCLCDRSDVTALSEEVLFFCLFFCSLSKKADFSADRRFG